MILVGDLKHYFPCQSTCCLHCDHCGLGPQAVLVNSAAWMGSMCDACVAKREQPPKCPTCNGTGVSR